MLKKEKNILSLIQKNMTLEKKKKLKTEVKKMFIELLSVIDKL